MARILKESGLRLEWETAYLQTALITYPTPMPELAQVSPNSPPPQLFFAFFRKWFHHDIGNHLNSVLGFSNVMRKGMLGPLNEVQQADLTRIYQNAKAIQAQMDLINDVLLIESGAGPLAHDQVVLPKLVTQIAEENRQQGHAAWQAELPEHLPVLSVSAPLLVRLLKYIELSLTDNLQHGPVALKATHTDGSVTLIFNNPTLPLPAAVVAEYQAVVAGASLLQCSWLPSLQLGIGLGFARLHQGYLTLESSKLAGSTVTLSLPL